MRPELRSLPAWGMRGTFTAAAYGSSTDVICKANTRLQRYTVQHAWECAAHTGRAAAVQADARPDGRARDARLYCLPNSAFPRACAAHRECRPKIRCMASLRWRVLRTRRMSISARAPGGHSPRCRVYTVRAMQEQRASLSGFSAAAGRSRICKTPLQRILQRSVSSFSKRTSKTCRCAHVRFSNR